ncbi:MAG TPA: alcohol dehydrogenase catalytic domain-containing protein [Candidatus Lumbricidophila sp.]|nr:alcohol dehydrogenase catalytic domain-containing protein [Candidatus Lumbricidophila sp.]
MRSAQYYGRNDIRLEDVPMPVPREGEVLVEVEFCGICGTDVEEFHDGPLVVNVEPHPLTGTKAPLALGHEVVGIVAGHGPGVDPTRIPVGTRVIPDVVIGCGECWWCERHEEGICERQAVRGFNLDGGLAEYMIADEATLVVVPPELDAKIAAFAEPVAVAVRAVRAAGDLSGTIVAVIGAGTIGLLIAQVARAAGAEVICSNGSAGRIAVARAAGFRTESPADLGDAIREVTDGRGVDVLFECTGLGKVVTSSLAYVRRGGTLVEVGLSTESATIDIAPFVLGEQRLIGTAAHLWDLDVAPAVELLASGVVDVSVLPTKIVPLSDVAEALANPNPAIYKQLISPKEHS